jgi:hypothetical protein
MMNSPGSIRLRSPSRLVMRSGPSPRTFHLHVRDDASEWSLEFDQLDQLAIQFAGDTRVPMIVNGKAFVKVIFCINRSNPLTQ